MKIIGDGLTWNEAALNLTPVVSDSFQVYVKVFAGKDLNATDFKFQIKIDETTINLDQFITSAARSAPAVGLDRTIKDFKNGIKRVNSRTGPFWFNATLRLKAF